MARGIYIVGQGRMGTALHGALRALARAGELYHASSRSFTRKPHRPSSPALTWVLAVRDGALPEAVAALLPVLKRGDVVLHLAGMLGPEVLAPAREKGAHVGSLHPLCAVADPKPPAWLLRGSAFLFEGDRLAR